MEQSSRKWFHKIVDPRYRRLHIVIISVALVAHLATHYATFFPFLQGPLADLPYFRLHGLHEAEFLLIIAYAGLVLGLWGGIIAVAVTGITSVPFILMPYIIGYTAAPGEVRDNATQVGFILLVGLFIALLYDRDKRRREAEALTGTLREVDRLRKNFISMASHEIRTPLTAVAGFSELLLSREASPEKHRKWAAAIHSEAARIAALIEDLLSVSRIEAGALDLRVQPLRLHDLVPAAVLAAAGPNHGHAVDVRIPGALPPAAADRERLMQVLVNLISNAMKYSPHGSRIEVSAASEAGVLRVAIADQGIGISPEDQAKLFTSFYRVAHQDTAGIQGTGLGLYIVKSLVELMGGAVNVRSSLGEGSVFSFTLPVWQGAPDAAPVAPSRRWWRCEQQTAP
ncbi:MAG: HAMP domain-containing sensor histidine kinase [Dehalococcoidia bacterium]